MSNRNGVTNPFSDTKPENDAENQAKLTPTPSAPTASTQAVNVTKKEDPLLHHAHEESDEESNMSTHDHDCPNIDADDHVPAHIEAVSPDEDAIDDPSFHPSAEALQEATLSEDVGARDDAVMPGASKQTYFAFERDDSSDDDGVERAPQQQLAAWQEVEKHTASHDDFAQSDQSDDAHDESRAAVGRQDEGQWEQEDDHLLQLENTTLPSLVTPEPAKDAVAKKPTGSTVASKAAKGAVAKKPTGSTVARKAAKGAVAKKPTGSTVARKAAKASSPSKRLSTPKRSVGTARRTTQNGALTQSRPVRARQSTSARSSAKTTRASAAPARPKSAARQANASPATSIGTLVNQLVRGGRTTGTRTKRAASGRGQSAPSRVQTASAARTVKRAVAPTQKATRQRPTSAKGVKKSPRPKST